MYKVTKKEIQNIVTLVSNKLTGEICILITM